MSNIKKYINLENKQIPIIIRNYKNTNNLKIYFKGTILNISKPIQMSNKKLLQIIDNNKKQILKAFNNIMTNENKTIKHWQTGETIMYKGEKYKILLEEIKEKIVEIQINEKEHIIDVKIYKDINSTQKKEVIETKFKQILKIKTYNLINKRLPYWSLKTQIKYNSFKIGNATSKFGSCIPSKKVLHFSNRLIMLPEDKVDAIIVHELCHIVHCNHSKDFYNLVKTYIPNYDEINTWLKHNSNMILF